MNKRHVNCACRLLSSAADTSDGLGRQIKEGGQSFHPLFHQLAAMHENQCIDTALRDEPRRDDSLAEGGGRGQYPCVMGKHGIGRRFLSGPQFAMEREFQRLSSATFIAN